MSELTEPIDLSGTLTNRLRLSGTIQTTGSDIAPGAPGDTSFLLLTDSPDTYVGAAGFVVAVNVGEDGLEFIEGGAGGVGPQGPPGDAADIQAEIDAATELDPPTDVTRFAVTLAGVLRFVRLDSIKTALTSLFDTLYAPIAKGVTGGDSHDHSGGDGGTIAYASLSGTPDIAELARDALGTALVAGAGITVTPSDGADTITVASTITQYGDVQAQAVVDATLAALDSDDIAEGVTNLYFSAAEVTKLAGIEAAADVTDAANVAAAGAVMDSELIDTSAGAGDAGKPIKLDAAGHVDASMINDADINLDNVTQGTTNKSYTTTEQTKLAGIEAAADVTDAGNISSSIHGATLDTTPLDADEVPGLDSSASFALIRWTWTSIKAFLKTYFDTLYELAGAIATHAALTATHGATGAISGTTNTQTLTNKTLASAVLTEILTLTPVSATIAAGVLTAAGVVINLDTEGAGATDDLVTITAGAQGQLIVLKSTSDSRDITIKNGTGNISCGSDRLLNQVQNVWFGIYTGDSWRQISFSDNIAPVVLDEGSWSPVITSSGTQPTMTYTIQEGNWWRHNKLYSYTITLVINSISVAGTGNLRISLPVASSAAILSGDGTCRLSGVDLPGTPLYATYNPVLGQAYGNILTTVDNAVNATVAVTTLSNGDAIIISGQFIAA